MVNFAGWDNLLINIDTIEEVEVLGDTAIKIQYKSGEKRTIQTEQDNKEATQKLDFFLQRIRKMHVIG